MRKRKSLKNGHIIINDKIMRETFFEKFNEKIENYSEYMNIDLDHDFSSILDNKSNILSCIKSFDNEFFFGEQEKVDYGNKIGNLRLIYGDTNIASDFIKIFERTLSLINNYIKIESLGKLFNENYFQLEWNLFMEMNFDKNEKKIYRDHFIHQVRDAYLGYILLAEAGLYENISRVIENAEKCEFIRYINMQVKKEAESRFIHYRDFFSEIGFFDNEEKNNQIQKLKKCITEEIIMKAWFVSALFHDIGYPIAHYYKLSDNIDRFMPQIRTLSTQNKKDFVELSTILSESYLFKTVPIKEIENLYLKNDHGVLSAICFLLHFYSTGTINRLSSSEKCIIELAADAMYKHTRKYSIQEEKNDYEYSRIYFHKEPLAYLLRVCDDIQEWERVYFEISSNNNILICKKCKAPVLKQNEIEKQIYTTYKCRCSENNCFERITTFNYRKINLISLCNSLDIHQEREIDKSVDKLTVNFNYDLYKQLEVLLVSPSFAFYRMKELNKVQKIFDLQFYFPDTSLKYQLSYNPIELKCWLIEKYIKKVGPNKSSINLLTDLVDELYENSPIKSEITSKIRDFYFPLVKSLIDGVDYIDQNYLSQIWIKDNKFLENLVDDFRKSSFDKENYNNFKKENEDHVNHILWSVNRYLGNKYNTLDLDYYSDLYLFKEINTRIVD